MVARAFVISSQRSPRVTPSFGGRCSMVRSYRGLVTAPISMPESRDGVGLGFGLLANSEVANQIADDRPPEGTTPTLRSNFSLRAMFRRRPTEGAPTLPVRGHRPLYRSCFCRGEI